MMSIKTSWNLGLLYKSDKDPQIEKDMKAVEAAHTSFEKKYRGKDFVSTPQKLLRALRDFQRLSEISNGKPWQYFSLRTELNSEDSKAGAMATKYEQRMTQAGNRVTFFELETAKISKRKQAAFLKSSLLSHYKYKLKRTFDNAKYLLSEGEEQVIDLLSQTSYTMWIDGNQKVVTKQLVKNNGKSYAISELLAKLDEFPDKQRAEWQKALNSKLKEISNFAEAEMNAICNYKKMLDGRRGFKKPYSATVLGYENEEREIEALVAAVTKLFTISERFYKLHAKLLGKKKLTYVDRSAKIGKIKKKFTFIKTLDIVRRALSSVDPKYGKILDAYVANGQIDVYPKKGKSGGAYCWGQADNPTFILLNHADNAGSVETLGHEMGHAIHTEMAQGQPIYYQKYSMATAETASTFFELVTLAELEKELKGEEKLIFLHNQIRGDIATIFRQIACFNFELALHEKIGKEGQVSGQGIAKLMSEHMQAYLGKATEVKEDDGYSFVQWSHIRRFFYVYSYAYGQLISRTMYEKWKKDPSYGKKVEQFLKAGRSMSPKDIFRSIGINTSDPKFFETGLRGIEEDIKKLEKLTS